MYTKWGGETPKTFICHPERSEGSSSIRLNARLALRRRSFAAAQDDKFVMKMNVAST